MLKSQAISILVTLWLTGTLLYPPVARSSAFQDKFYDDYGMEFNGFVEVRQGWRLQDDPHEKDASISETRVQVDLSKDLDWGIFTFKGDLIGDGVTDSDPLDVREVNVSLSPFDAVDLKIGRQILTWGTGDLLFINDLFPKDWQSFFIGRDDEYLKAPADAIKMSIFLDFFNMSLVYAPIFNESRYIDGSRLSYWNPVRGRRAGRDFIFDDHERNRMFQDGEMAARISKNIRGAELAVYGFKGYWKTPEGVDPAAMKLTYPDLLSVGASARAAVFGGIGSLEIGWYDSLDDRDGENPLVRNSEYRFLAGFERELARDLTAGIQYYLEWMADYDAYRRNQPGPATSDEYRHVVTLRLTQRLMHQNLRLSVFGYYSPSDADVYLRPKIHYKITDRWAAEIGGNIFTGKEHHTFFGQFEKNTNAYGAIRWRF